MMSCTRPLVWLAAVALPVVLSAQSPQLVDIGTHKLDVLRAGTGTPTIVFEAGLGDDGLDDWRKVWPVVAQLSSVVVYSRSGNGRSQLGTGDHSAHTCAVELHALLSDLDLKPPYILVGRSYGGILVRLYASLYPNEVAGMVLVDATHEQQVRRWGAIDSTYPAAFRRYFDSVLTTLKPGADAAETRETMRIQAAGEVEGMKPLPDMPLAVLTSMRVDPQASSVNGTARGHEAWREMHDEWFHRSSNAIHIVTTKSGHAIQDQEPDLVVQAIRFVLDRVHAPRSP
jgi:pimeloyl-ACP methyl ester carboxylesterase